jgi:hypothetical protein
MEIWRERERERERGEIFHIIPQQLKPIYRKKK